jgi:hypothetical protein
MGTQRARRRPFLIATAGVLALGATLALAVILTPTPKQVTNTTGGSNQNATIDKGAILVFTSNVNHVSGVMNSSPASAFDYNNAGNDFTPPLGSHPSPACLNCAGSDTSAGNLYLWRMKAKSGLPANSILELTFSTAGGFAANQLPDVNQKATVVAWDSDQDHVGTNADGNREIFVADLTSCNASATPPCPITQVTNTSGGGDSANRNVSVSDDGRFVVFDSTRDYASVSGCTLVDGTTACSNADNNSEIMLYDRTGAKLTQLTSTTGSSSSANIRPRISNDGKVVAWQSTRDFSGVLPGGATCTLVDGATACANDGNGEIMLLDLTAHKMTQVTNTTNVAPCSGSTPNERVEVSKGGKYVTWQSMCEAQLNPTGCGSCDGNDEAFLLDTKHKVVEQITISQGGFNRVPRVAGGGGFIVFESNRDYNNLNLGHAHTLYVVKRNTRAGKPGLTGAGQLLEDAGSTLVQNPATKVLIINFAGGFNSSVEQFGASTNGRFFSFDNSKGVGNQEIWFLDRNK